MIIGSPVGLLALLASTAAELLLRFLAPGVVDEERAVEEEVLVLEEVVAGELVDAARDDGAGRLDLGDEAAAPNLDADVELLGALLGDEEGFHEHGAGQLGLEDLDGDAVDANPALAFLDGHAGDRGLAFSGGD